MARVALIFVIASALLACAADARRTAHPDGTMLITHVDQREASVDREVTVVGIQTRTKVPQVCGVDVDGDYALSDREVIARGVLRRIIITEVDNTIANRGTGTFYWLEDPTTGRISQTRAH